MIIPRRYSFVTDGRNGVEYVAGLLWNQWPECRGIHIQVRFCKKKEVITNLVKLFPDELSLLRSQLECWNNGILEYWVLGNCGSGLLAKPY